MRDDVPFGYTLDGEELVQNPADSRLVSYIFEATNRYSEAPPVWGNLTVGEENAVFCGDKRLCEAFDFAKICVTTEINIATVLVGELEDMRPGLSTADVLCDAELSAEVRQRLEKEDAQQLIDLYLNTSFLAHTEQCAKLSRKLPSASGLEMKGGDGIIPLDLWERVAAMRKEGTKA